LPKLDAVAASAYSTVAPPATSSSCSVASCTSSGVAKSALESVAPENSAASTVRRRCTASVMLMRFGGA
jgi:hypothetical protein